MEIRRFDAKKDKHAAHQIWIESGWLKKDKTDIMDIFLRGTHSWVAEINGQAESLASTAPGTIWYRGEAIPFSGVVSVSTSRVGRRRDLATRTTAKAVADSVERGALVSALGMFEQGFYNRLGFGTGSYEHLVRFDPSALKVDVKPGVPVRLSAKDSAAVHKSRLRRRKCHGCCDLDPLEMTSSWMKQPENAFGLGFRNGPKGELTHHIWANARDNSENGPYDIWWLSFQNRQQFLELMALVRSWGDQIRLVTMREPPGIQFQDFLKKPFYRGQISRKSSFESGIRAMAYWQARICDLPGCLSKTRLPNASLRFNLELTDPIRQYLGEKQDWKGIAGTYVVELGEPSHAEKGSDPSLPTLKAGLGAFTRLWLGVLPATSLAVSDSLEGPEELLIELDSAFRLPVPHPDWDF